MLQELRKNDPNLMTLIQENQEEFMRILGEPLPAGTGLDESAFGGAGGGDHSCHSVNILPFRQYFVLNLVTPDRL